MPVIFPDIEKTLVNYFRPLLNGVHVAVKKTSAEETQPAQELVVTANYTFDKEHTLKYANAVFEIYATEYAEATNLALLVEALLRDATVASIKKVDITLGPIRIAESGPYEKRSIAAELTIKGTDA